MKIISLIFLLALDAIGATQISVIDFEAGTNGTVVDLGALTNSTRGTPLQFVTVGGLSGMSNDSVFGQKELAAWVNTQATGYPFTKGMGTKSLRSDLAVQGHQIKAFPPSGATNGASAGTWFFCDRTYDGTVNYDIFNLHSVSDFAGISFQLNSNSTRFSFQLENSAGGGYPLLELDRNTWYWVTIALKVDGSNSIALYDSTGTNFLTSGRVAYTSTNPVTWLEFGGSSITLGVGGSNMWMDSILMDFSSSPVWPLLPGVPHGLQVIVATNAYSGTLTNARALP